MYKYDTGVFLDCYRIITNKAVDEVAKIGAKYIQMYATMPQMKTVDSGRKHSLARVRWTIQNF